jgi:hypothetical protein
MGMVTAITLFWSNKPNPVIQVQYRYNIYSVYIIAVSKHCAVQYGYGHRHRHINTGTGMQYYSIIATPIQGKPLDQAHAL